MEKVLWRRTVSQHIDMLFDHSFDASVELSMCCPCQMVDAPLRDTDGIYKCCESKRVSSPDLDQALSPARLTFC